MDAQMMTFSRKYDKFPGTLKGNGAGFTKLVERLIRGAWTPTAMETMQPSL